MSIAAIIILMATSLLLSIGIASYLQDRTDRRMGWEAPPEIDHDYD